jgi:hypothetical protein
MVGEVTGVPIVVWSPVDLSLNLRVKVTVPPSTLGLTVAERLTLWLELLNRTLRFAAVVVVLVAPGLETVPNTARRSDTRTQIALVPVTRLGERKEPMPRGLPDDHFSPTLVSLLK